MGIEWYSFESVANDEGWVGFKSKSRDLGDDRGYRVALNKAGSSF